jgi:hypothetical protein
MLKGKKPRRGRRLTSENGRKEGGKEGRMGIEIGGSEAINGWNCGKWAKR